MKKLTGKVKGMMIALLAVVSAGAGVALTAMAQGERRHQDPRQPGENFLDKLPTVEYK
jgi:hypothetical protein